MEKETGKRIIVLTGPESTGKTSLAMTLADFFHTNAGSEYARTFLNNLNRPYTLFDLEDIAHGQLSLERQVVNESSEIVILDTDLLVVFIWAQIKYGYHFDWIEEKLRQQTNKLYLLCSPDIPWVPDPLRENPNDRAEIFEVYINELTRLGLEYRIVSGSGSARMESAIRTISDWK